MNSKRDERQINFSAYEVNCSAKSNWITVNTTHTFRTRKKACDFIDRYWKNLPYTINESRYLIGCDQRVNYAAIVCKGIDYSGTGWLIFTHTFNVRDGKVL